MADVAIRQQTDNKASLRTALIGIHQAGGTLDSEQAWSIQKVFAIGDQATGTKVLQQLYQQHSSAAILTDLPTLWQDLGIKRIDDRIVFDDQSPLSKLRRELLEKP